MNENEDRKRPDGRDPEPGDDQEFLPPLDFSSIVFPFYTQGLFKMGLMDSPEPGKQVLNLDLAKRLIDILDLLKDRTQGNLKPDEARFLESCLLQLKARYLEKAKIIKT